MIFFYYKIVRIRLRYRNSWWCTATSIGGCLAVVRWNAWSQVLGNSFYPLHKLACMSWMQERWRDVAWSRCRSDGSYVQIGRSFGCRNVIRRSAATQNLQPRQVLRDRWITGIGRIKFFGLGQAALYMFRSACCLQWIRSDLWIDRLESTRTSLVMWTRCQVRVLYPCLLKSALELRVYDRVPCHESAAWLARL